MEKQTGFNNYEDFEKWVKEVENRMFEIDKFKEMGKEHDYIFQTLVFMGKASAQMSLGYTIASDLKEIPKTLKDEMRDLASRYHELQEQIRKIS